MAEELGFSIVQRVIQRKEPSLRVVVDETLRNPRIDFDGKIIKVPEPSSLVPLELNMDKTAMKRLFEASVSHLSAHFVLLDVDTQIEDSLKQGYGENGRVVSKILSEVLADNHVAKSFPEFGRQIAFANAVALLRQYPIDASEEAATKLISTLISLSLANVIKGGVSHGEIEALHSVQRLFSEAQESSCVERIVKSARPVCEALKVVDLAEIGPSFATAPHREGNDGMNFFGYVFQESPLTLITGKGKTVVLEALSLDQVLRLSSKRLALDIRVVVESVHDRAEAEVLFNVESRLKERGMKVLAEWEALRGKTKFTEVNIPEEDYDEYLRIRQGLSTSIKRLILSLKQTKVASREIRDHSGYPIMLEAIQVIASKVRRSNIFFRRKKCFHKASWVILLDKSASLIDQRVKIKELSTCLAEVADSLLDDRSWAFYAFDDSISIVKDFDEGYTRSIKARIGGLTTGGGTYTPDAISIATSKLGPRRGPLKVIILITDGEPQGYEGINEEMKKVVRETGMRGVKLAAICVGAYALSGIRRRFPYYSCIRNLKELVNNFTELYYTLLM